MIQLESRKHDDSKILVPNHKASASDEYQFGVQCPFAGGNSVYRARVLLSLIGDTAVYHDLAVCHQEGLYRLSQNTQGISTVTKDKIRVITNPADDQVDVVIHDSHEGVCHLSLFDSFGRMVLNMQLDCSIKKHSLSLKGIVSGAYMVQIQMKENQVQRTKLIIAK